MTDYEEVEAYLAHHGVKGMRWGVHKTGQATITVSNRTKFSNQQIKDARSRVATELGALGKVDRMGSREAQQQHADRLRQVTQSQDYRVSKLLTTGEKRTKQILFGTVSGVGAGIAIAGGGPLTLAALPAIAVARATLYNNANTRIYNPKTKHSFTLNPDFVQKINDGKQMTQDLISGNSHLQISTSGGKVTVTNTIDGSSQTVDTTKK